MKKKLSRVPALAIALLLALSCIAYAETDENGNTAVESVITNEMNMTVEDWLSGPDNHVLFVTTTILDCLGIWTEADTDTFTTALANNSVYVSAKEGLLYISAFSDEAYMIYAYSPDIGLAYYSINVPEDAAMICENHATVMEIMVTEGIYDEYYAVDGQSVIDMLTDLSEMLGE